MSYRQEPYYRRRRRGNGCLIWLVALIWIVLLAVLAYRFWLRPQVSQYVGQQIGSQLLEPAGGQANQQIEQGAGPLGRRETRGDADHRAGHAGAPDI